MFFLNIRMFGLLFIFFCTSLCSMEHKHAKSQLANTWSIARDVAVGYFAKKFGLTKTAVTLLIPEADENFFEGIGSQSDTFAQTLNQDKKTPEKNTEKIAVIPSSSNQDSGLEAWKKQLIKSVYAKKKEEFQEQIVLPLQELIEEELTSWFMEHSKELFEKKIDSRQIIDPKNLLIKQSQCLVENWMGTYTMDEMKNFLTSVRKKAPLHLSKLNSDQPVCKNAVAMCAAFFMMVRDSYVFRFLYKDSSSKRDEQLRHRFLLFYPIISLTYFKSKDQQLEALIKQTFGKPREEIASSSIIDATMASSVELFMQEHYALSMSASTMSMTLEKTQSDTIQKAEIKSLVKDLVGLCEENIAVLAKKK